MKMYSVRVTSNKHGNSFLIILLIVAALTVFLSVQYSINYLVIYFSSALIHVLIETGLSISGLRNGNIHLNGRKVPKWIDICLRSFVEGPAYCVPSFFVADRLFHGNELWSIGITFIIVLLGSLYLGLYDKRQLIKLKPDEIPIKDRRYMNRPGAVILLALLNTICLAAIFFLPDSDRNHAFLYLISYSVFVMLYYLINYNLGVRMIELHDPDTNEYIIPGRWFQAAALTYDSAYEMALLISPAYWVTYYLGIFH